MTAVCAPHAIDTERERAAIRAELNRRRMLREAGAIADLDLAERQTERDATAAMRQDKSVVRADLAERRRMRNLNAARNRDRMRSALDYPMSDAELETACQHATLVAKVPAERMPDIAQSLAEYVIRRHGRNPARVKVTAGGLRKLAVMLYLAERRKDERATGSREAADQLANWTTERDREALAGLGGGDAVYALAEHKTAAEISSVVQVRELDPVTMAERLGLKGKCADALAVAIDSHRIRPLRGSERERYNAAIKSLRSRFQDEGSVLLAVRPDSYAARVLTDAAVRSLKGSLPGDSGAGGGTIKRQPRVTDGREYPVTFRRMT